MIPDIVTAMHHPRLPEPFTAIGWDDLLSMFGLGLLLAVAVLTLFAPILRKRVPPPSLSSRIKAAADLPEQERLLALARLLGERGGSLPEDLRHALYTGQNPDPAKIEALIRSARRGRG